MSRETAVVGERLAGERANGRIAGFELIEDARHGSGIEGGAVLDNEQQGNKERRNHSNPGWRIRPFGYAHRPKGCRLGKCRYYLAQCAPVRAFSSGSSARPDVVERTPRVPRKQAARREPPTRSFRHVPTATRCGAVARCSPRHVTACPGPLATS